MLRRAKLGVALLAFAIVLLIMSFAANSDAHTPSVTHVVKCDGNSGDWNVTFTVHNDPNGKYGAAKISGTGTSLDGATIPKSGSKKLTLHEKSGVGSVALSGRLSWPDGYSAPFSDFAKAPNGCGDTGNKTVTKTVEVPGPTITVPGPTTTVTEKVTETVSATETVPGCVIAEVGSPDGFPACPTRTVTQTLRATLPPQTVYVTKGNTTVVVTKTAAGATQTKTVYNCPPDTTTSPTGPAQQASLAYTGSGDNSLLAVVGGALLLIGMGLTFFGRKRSAGFHK